MWISEKSWETFRLETQFEAAEGVTGHSGSLRLRQEHDAPLYCGYCEARTKDILSWTAGYFLIRRRTSICGPRIAMWDCCSRITPYFPI